MQPGFPQQQQQQQQPQPNMANNPNLMPRMPHQGPAGMNQAGNFPGNQGQRMPFTQGQNQQANHMGGNQMIVNQSGPSLGGAGILVPNSGLSPFGCANSSGMTPNSNASGAAVVAQQNAQMLSNRPIMSPSNEFNPNMIHVVSGQQNKQNQQQQSMNSQAPSPFNQSQNQNVFNNNLMMQNSQRMLPPTPTSDLIPVPSPSPSLNSNGPPPVSTPNTPNVASLFNRPEPTPPPMPIASPSHAGGKGQSFGGSMSGGNMSNSNSSGKIFINISPF
jgi:hypothetical protein